MAKTRSTLARIEGQVLESMGRRDGDAKPRLSPIPSRKDVGRRPAPGFGRIGVHDVAPDPMQPRTQFSEEAIERLAHSIREKGQLAPIRVRWSEEAGKWLIIAGERRWRATCRAGLEIIECYFHEGDLAQSQVLEQQLIENLLREDLKLMEEARAFQSLMELNGWNGKQVAEALRVPASKVSRTLALLKLPEDVRQLVDDGDLPSRSAYELSKLTDQGQQRQLAKQAASGRLNHDATSRTVRRNRGKPRQRPRGTKLTFTTERGWKTVVSAPKRGTYFEVEQALQEALEEVRHCIANNVQLF